MDKWRPSETEFDAYVLAARSGNEIIRVLVEGVDGGSISMLSVQI